MSRYIAFSMFVLFTLTTASAATRHVPADYSTIQAAILASTNGDTVLVEPGTYFENINFRGRNIVVASRYLLTGDLADISSTVINGSTPAFPDTASCVLIINHETSAAVLEGFTLTGGKGTAWLDEHGAGLYREGGGILIALSAPTIRNNFIVGNSCDRTGVRSCGGGGIRMGDGNPTILNNMIVRNTARYGAGLVLNYTGAQIRNNVIAQNVGGEDFGGAGVWINSSGPAAKVLENNTIADNTTNQNDGGGLLIQSTSVTALNNIIWGNTARTGPQVSIDPGTTLSLIYSDVEGGYAGLGNINATPLFTDSSYYLTPASPCADAGNSIAGYNDREDSAHPGNARFPSRGGLRNDMGAYGGQGARPAVYVDQHLNDPRPAASFTAYSDYLTPTSVTLHWIDPTTRNDGSPLAGFKFNLYRGGTLIAQVDSGVQTYVDPGRTTHQLYHYYLRTIVPGDSSTLDSATANAGGHAQPKPPVLFSVTDASTGVNLKWKNPSQQLDGTPLNDLAYVLIYRDGQISDSLAQSSSDTAQVRTVSDTSKGFHYYRIRVRDNESPVNYSVTTDSVLGFGRFGTRDEEHFENGTGNVFRNGSWDTTSAISFDGARSITDSPGGGSTPSSETSVILPTILLGAQPVLRFRDIAIVRPGSFAVVDISKNQRKTFQVLTVSDWNSHASWQDQVAGPSDWIDEVVDLTPYAGDTVSIRFRLITASSSPGDGWYLDDIYAGPADTATTFSSAFSASWNMISIPLKSPPRPLGDLLPGGSSAFSFLGKYIKEDSLRNGTGYWVKLDSAVDFAMSGNIVPKETVDVRQGWNMIGMMSTPIDPSAVSGLPPSIVASAWYTFDTVYHPASQLEPGRSYWVRCSSAGKLVLNSLIGGAASKRSASVNPMAENRITFTDRDGRSQTLSFAPSGVSGARRIELPPTPPAGAFDIRFSSGVSTELTAEGLFRAPISFQSVRFPLTVKWQTTAEYSAASLVVSNRNIPLLKSGTAIIPDGNEEARMILQTESTGDEALPKEFGLSQNFPNPFNPVTGIRYELPERAFVTLKVYDVLGREVRTLVSEVQDAGIKSVLFNATELSTGAYFYRLNAGSFVSVKRMLLVR